MRIATVWQLRERVEREAASLFRTLANNLRHFGMPDAIVDLADGAAVDEDEHAQRCRRIVDKHDRRLRPLRPQVGVRLGPADLSPRERMVFEAVALSCVTESLSVALLLEMRRAATDSLVGETVAHILKDEVRHSRLGWAVLAEEARHRDVSWLAPHVDGMVRAALASDLSPLTGDANGSDEDLPGYGVLPREGVRAITSAALRDVVLPGLTSFGIDVSSLVQPGR